ncbi:hypothetical protein HID58_083512 [Brassica napus]|uniref:Uncharacterized protein n=1 Tax=Brassica napus TaxID=3708 RepID=A0ABQ7YDJ0_BRANA|nr:hypothetical protein HID58_083512 [Brassica napus]
MGEFRHVGGLANFWTRGIVRHRMPMVLIIRLSRWPYSAAADWYPLSPQPIGILPLYTIAMSSQRRQRRQAQRKRARERYRRMNTWRKQQPSFLCPVMSQKKSTCYAIAFVRQLEFHLKLHNRMPHDQHPSIQDFINLIPKHYLDADGELIVDAARVLSIFVKKGILLERDCPLTERIDGTVSEETDCTRYYAKKVTKHMLHPGRSRMATQKKYELFHADLIEKLKGGVVAVGVSVYPSYSNLKHKDECLLLYQEEP